MAIDKLTMMTIEKTSADYLYYLNREFKKPEEERHFIFDFKREVAGFEGITEGSRVAIYTKPHISPFVRVELNFRVPGSKEPPSTRVETNPNNFPAGWSGLQTLVELIFGKPVDLRITRVDLNADIEDVSVQYFRDALRVPKKRKCGEILEWKNKGIETFYIGKNPAKLRTYDKIQEQRYKGADVSNLPEVLTRIEWELHSDRILKGSGLPAEYGVRRPAAVLGKSKTQAFYFSELPVLRECRPFRGLQFIEGVPYYDFRTKSTVTDSIKRFAHEAFKRQTFDSLAEKFGANDAIRILNSNRHFSRDYKTLVLDNEKVRKRIEAAFKESITRFFSNRASHVHSVYSQCLRCIGGDEIKGCAGCGFRLCEKCISEDESHDSGCPIKGAAC